MPRSSYGVLLLVLGLTGQGSDLILSLILPCLFHLVYSMLQYPAILISRGTSPVSTAEYGIHKRYFLCALEEEHQNLSRTNGPAWDPIKTPLESSLPGISFCLPSCSTKGYYSVDAALHVRTTFCTNHAAMTTRSVLSQASSEYYHGHCYDH